MSSNSPSGGMKEMVRSFSKRERRTHWWNFTSSMSTDLLFPPATNRIPVSFCEWSTDVFLERIPQQLCTLGLISFEENEMAATYSQSQQAGSSLWCRKFLHMKDGNLSSQFSVLVFGQQVTEARGLAARDQGGCGKQPVQGVCVCVCVCVAAAGHSDLS